MDPSLLRFPRITSSRSGLRCRVERTLEFAGHPGTQEQSILATAKHGASVCGGICHSGLKLSEKAVDAILRKEITITRSWNSSFAPLISDWETALMFVDMGK